MILPTCVAHCNKTIPSASVLSSNRLVPASLSLSLFISCRHSATSRLSVPTQVCLPSTIATISTPIRLYCWTSPQSCSTHELPRPLQSPTYNSTPKYLRYPRFSCHGPLTTSCAFSTLCCGGSTEFFFSSGGLVVTEIVGTHNVEIANVETEPFSRVNFFRTSV